MSDDFSSLPGYGMPLYGSPAPRDAIVQALMSGGQSMSPTLGSSSLPSTASSISSLGSIFKNNPKLLDNLKQWFSGPSTPSDTVPGTGLFGTNLFGTSLATGAAPGPNQIIPM